MNVNQTTFDSFLPAMAPNCKDDDELVNVVMACCSGDLVWGQIKREAEEMRNEPTTSLDSLAASLLPGIIESSVLQFDTLEEALANHLAKKLSWDAAPKERWQSLLLTAFKNGTSSDGEPLSLVMRKDLLIIKERDPACPSLVHAVLHFKGFQGIQVYRVAHWLWQNEQRSLASVLQSRVSEVFAMDIHPAAKIGWGVMIDHGTGVVIGETAVVGDGCTLLHGVTLGGTGKQSGDRHPKLGTKVLVGAGASILGNIKIGDCAKIGASAVVLKDIPSFATAVGSPAKVIGRSNESNPASGLDHACSFVDIFKNRKKCLCPFRQLECPGKGFLGPYDFMDRIRKVCGVANVKFGQATEIFFQLDLDHDGKLTEKEFNDNVYFLKEKFESKGSKQP